MSFLYQCNDNFPQQLGTDDITLAFSPDQIIMLSACERVVKKHGAGDLWVLRIEILCSYMSAWEFGAACDVEELLSRKLW